MQRRGLLQTLGLACLPGTWLLGCRRLRGRSEVLAALVRDVQARDVRALVEQSRELASRTRSLAASPSAREIHAVRDAWRTAAVAWKRAQTLKLGPLADSRALLRATFWPARSAAIDVLLRENVPITSALVEAAGVDVRGIFGLEYLLFDRESGAAAPVRVAGQSGDRARSLAVQCALDVCRYAELALAELGPNGEHFAASFAAGGQQSVGLVVGQMIENLESLAENRLALLLWMDGLKRLKPADVEGFPSGMSKELFLALLRGVEESYRGGAGGGLSDLVAPLAPALDRGLRSDFAEATALGQQLAGPLERVVTSDRASLERLRSVLKALEIRLKTELTSALGLTLAFTSTDGD